MLLKADAPAPVVIGVRVWPRAIPQFNIAHMDVLEVRCAFSVGLSLSLEPGKIYHPNDALGPVLQLPLFCDVQTLVYI